MTVHDAPAHTRPPLLQRFGFFLTRHAKVVLALALLLMIAAAALGTRAFGELKSGGFADPGSDSAAAAAITSEHFASDPNLVMVVSARDGSLQSAAVQQAGAALTRELATREHVTIRASYFTTPAPSLAAKDGSSGLILAVIGGDQSQAVTVGAALGKEFSGDRGPITVKVGGNIGVFGDINSHVASSLAIAEAIAVPVTLLLLLLVFGSVVAALLPLLIGGLAIVGTFAELAILGQITDVSVFAINLTTALGLGLGIDYGLLIVARFREQLARGEDVPTAVARTVATAGRTILFSAAAVMAALATLTFFPLYFLSSFGYAGIGVVATAAVAAIVITPAALALLGHRVDKGRLPWAGAVRGSESPFWGRVAAVVFRRPVLTATPVLVLLLLAASPLLGVHFALPDETVLPQNAPSRQVSTIINEQYPSRSTATITVVSSGPVTGDVARSEAAALSTTPGVSQVVFDGGSMIDGVAGPADPTAGVLASQGYQKLLVRTTAEGGSDQAANLVWALRAVPPSGDVGFLVGGPDAGLTDTLHGISRPLPWVLGTIVVTTFVLLFLFTGSVVQPIRALVINTLSLSASVGIVTWIFQDGHLISLFGATPRPMDASMVVLLLCITFGLSMDYEVFLSSRITELHYTGHDLRTSVVGGLARTGRIVTSAALLLSVSFFAFATSSVSMLQLFGLGAGLAVLIDATLVRGVLVPATMRILGRANFWAPKPLARWYQRVGIAEE